MMRASRRFHLVAVALILLSALVFFHSSWDRTQSEERVGTEAEIPHGQEQHMQYGKQSPGEHTAKPYAAHEEVKGESKKGVKQVVLDKVASSTAPSPVPTTTGSSRSEPPKIIAASTPARSVSSRSSSSAPPASASTAAPLIPYPDPSKITPTYDRAVVVGKLQREDVGWVGDKLPDWQRAIYTIDNPTSGQLHTLVNKGHEAMAFLSYIIEHYDKLPATIVFLRSKRTAFLRPYHFEGEAFDVVELVRTMNMDHVQEIGYANLRCADVVGCAEGTDVSQNPRDDRSEIVRALTKSWRELFHELAPSKLGGPCSGEFAVSRKQILQRPLSDYYHYWDWLIRTPLDDDTSGGVFECSWHVIFGQEPFYCPTEKKCHCDLYRRC